MTETAVYTCSICNEPSTDICVRCTKDACRNHRCERCKACSDCCECEVPLTGPEPQIPQQAAEAKEVVDVFTSPQNIQEPEPNISAEPLPEATPEPEQPPPAF